MIGSGRSHAALVAAPIDRARLEAAVAAPDAGAIVSFVGVVRDRNEGRAVKAIDYAAYEPMAAAELAAIAGDCAARWPGVRVALEHRIGLLVVGEASVAVLVAHAHRAEAFDACRWAIDAVKHRVPIWKREHYVDGTREWVAARAAPRPPRRSRTARARPGARARGPGMVDAELRDGVGRRIEYLRLSLTDRCNFRCVYCMPVAGLPWIPRPDLLTDDELVALVAELVPLGLRRVRLTGGEPTLRPGLPALVARLRAVAGLTDLSLSTNGVRLPALAPALAAAGLDRVNVSVDSLRPARIAAIARRDLGFDPVRALEAASAAGLAPVKVNVVLVRGVNDDEVEALAGLTLAGPWHVRFIELMPVGELAAAPPPGDDPLARVVPSGEVVERLAALGRALGRPLAADAGPGTGNGPAVYHRFEGAGGTVGVITPMTHTYCGACNRVRVTADGGLRTCLYGEDEVSLRAALRAGRPLAPLVMAALAGKPREHALLARRAGGLRALSQVGG